MKNAIRTTVEVAALAAIAVLALELVDAEKARDALEAERADLRSQLAAADERLRAPARSQTESVGIRHAPTSETFSSTSERVGNEHRAGATFVAADPSAGGAKFIGSVRPEWVDGHMREHLRRCYESLLRQPEFAGVADKLVRLLSEKRSVAHDVLEAAHAQGVYPTPENRPQLHALMQSASEAVETQIKGLLGDGAYREFQNFEQTLPHRATVEQLSGRLAAVGESLSASQAEQLVRILDATSPAGASPDDALVAPVMAFGVVASDAREGVVTSSAMVAGPAGIITDAAVEQARAVLTETQQKALQKLRADRQTMQQKIEMLPPPPGGIKVRRSGGG